MDLLDQLADPAVDLLGRVDGILAAAGAPDEHRLWPLLRQLRVLPGDAVDAVLALRPAPLTATGAATRTVLGTYDEVRDALVDDGSWQGPAAETFAAHRDALRAYLVDGVESLTGRLDATAAYAEAVADWIAHTRDALARTLGDVLGSAEAVAVVTARTGGGAPVELAAAEIGARVLATVAEAYDRAEALPGQWAPDLDEVAYRPPDGSAVRPDGGRIAL
ncbi:hypothetical protein ACFP2T_20710 [Plantactinospora solaniradicis]|uniref:Uncharacterized protein n=1 Tax=Plantactinospora solaniradicis TaxID=1723736 RepID=A0ABW1KCY5_9ACTN